MNKDVQKRLLKQSKIKRFTLKATASAILAFNAEVIHATNCPAQITDNSLASDICDFVDINSVTVENGGVVGGIVMDSYNPISSFIMINAGGSVINTTRTGISIGSSTLSNGLVNNGTISVGGTDISISNSTVNGISNSGEIISTAVGTGIKIYSASTINGGITNSGTIVSGGVDVGITISEDNTINGDISNTGTITSDSGNGILISATNVIQGNISNSGTISAGNEGIALLSVNTLNGGILNSGSIDASSDGIRVSNANTINGNISNSGSITAGAVGILINSQNDIGGGISNSGTIRAGEAGITVTSSSSLSGGISNSGTIQGDINAIYVDASSEVDDIDILGLQARLVGAVEAVNTNVNITSGAVFTSEGSFNVQTFNIADNAVFNMANTITVQNAVNNAGTLAIGSGTQTIAGDYTQVSGGVLQVAASSATDYGQLSVTGAIDLSQSGHINVQLAPDFSLHEGDILSDVLSGNTLITPTNDFNVTDNSFLWKFNSSLNNTNSGVNLTAAIDPAAYNACQGNYCEGAATTIIDQVAAGNSVFSPYAALTTESAFQAAASQATPELINENTQIVRLVTNSVMDIVPLWNTLHAYPGTATTPAPASGTVWLKPYTAGMTQNENNTVDGFNARASGVVIGKDIQRTENWLLGGAFATGVDNVYGRSLLNDQSIHSKAYEGMLYGVRTLPHDLYFAVQGLVGYGDNDTSRSIPLYASTARGSYDSWFTNLRAQFGWNDYLLNRDLVLTPELELSYLFVKQGAYQESGSPMDLSVESNNNSSLMLGAYEHAAYRLTTFSNLQDLTATAYAGVARDVLNHQPKVSASFVAGGPSFSTFGVQPNQTVIRGGVGLSLMNPAKPLSLSLNYDVQSGNDAYSNVVALTIAYKLDA